ncbi:MAG TPA: serine/threonine-protein kinase [Rhodothermales bacterium]|nr:serine/threonine-protein kinase [Rhodothermales bacterium]
MNERAWWLQIQAAFDEILDLPQNAQAEALSLLPLPLQTEVAALLHAAEKADAYLGQAGQTIRKSIRPPNRTDVQIGPYLLQSLLGEGGMGTVYRAKRIDGAYDQEVAIKVLQNTLSPGLHQRFLAERQILANLRHPHIAQLVDGGTTSEGLPWLAMELVEGEPITSYCVQKELSQEARIQLLLQVCEAVRFAHRNLVVHRDIKPSNILVTSEGKVKLLDFGIAKLIESDTPQYQTVSRHIWLTPAYASPEQLRGESITTSSDVYQLGRILYELLTPNQDFSNTKELGHTYKKQNLRSNSSPPNRARNFPIGRRFFFTKAAVHELDAICQMALRNEPERRYGTVEALITDLQHFLVGLPVAAQPDSFGYHVKKFVARHRLPVVIGIAAMLIAFGSAIFMALQQREIREERDRARSEAERAQLVASFMEEMYALGESDAARGGIIQVKRLLEQSEAKLHRIGAYNPGVRGQLMDVIARAHTQLGNHRKALSLRFHALKLKQQTFGEQHIETAITFEDLTSSYMYLFMPDSAAYYMARSLTLFEKLLPPNDPKTLYARMHLGTVREAQHRNPEAITLYQQAESGYQSLSNPPQKDIANLYNSWGYALLTNRQYDAAEPILAKALSAASRYNNGYHEITPMILGSHGLMYAGQRKLRPAADMYARVVETRAGLLGWQNKRIVLSLYYLGNFQLAAGMEREALRTYQKIAELQQNLNAFTAEEKELNAFYRTLLHYRLSEFTPAKQAFSEIKSLFKANATPSTDLKARLQYIRLLFLATLMETPSIFTALEKDISVLITTYPNNPEALETQGLLADLYLQKGDLERAEKILLSAHDALEQLPGMNLRFQIQIWSRLNRLYVRWGKLDLAKKWRIS